MWRSLSVRNYQLKRERARVDWPEVSDEVARKRNLPEQRDEETEAEIEPLSEGGFDGIEGQPTIKGGTESSPEAQSHSSNSPSPERR